MLPVLIKSVLSSVFVGLIDADCLRPFAIRHGFPQTLVLGFALGGAVAIPLLIPIADHLHFQSANSSMVRPAYSMTLLQELQEMLQARSGPGLLPKPLEAPIQATNPPRAEKPSRPATGSAPDPGPASELADSFSIPSQRVKRGELPNSTT
jgi:hypothetical protein